MASPLPPPPERARATGRDARSRRLALALTLAVAWTAAAFGTAAAHGALIRGSVTLAPDPPQPGRPMVLTVDLATAGNRPVEGATLVADLKTQAPSPSAATATPQTIPLQEYKEPYGTYRAQLAAPPAGSYTLILHDHTGAGEDATATVPLRIGGTVANGSLGFTFPAAHAGGGSVTRWLLWLIALPLAVGIVVSVLVRRSKREEARADADDG